MARLRASAARGVSDLLAVHPLRASGEVWDTLSWALGQSPRHTYRELLLLALERLPVTTLPRRPARPAEIGARDMARMAMAASSLLPDPVPVYLN